MALGLSQYQVADGITSSSHLSLIESGKRPTDLELLEDLAARLDETVDWLLWGRRSALHSDDDSQQIAALALMSAAESFECDPHARSTPLSPWAVAQRLRQMATSSLS